MNKCLIIVNINILQYRFRALHYDIYFNENTINLFTIYFNILYLINLTITINRINKYICYCK